MSENMLMAGKDPFDPRNRGQLLQNISREIDVFASDAQVVREKIHHLAYGIQRVASESLRESLRRKERIRRLMESLREAAKNAAVSMNSSSAWLSEQDVNTGFAAEDSK